MIREKFDKYLVPVAAVVGVVLADLIETVTGSGSSALFTGSQLNAVVTLALCFGAAFVAANAVRAQKASNERAREARRADSRNKIV